MIEKRSGFTLIELITVVAMIAVIAAIAIPVFIGASERAREGVAVADAAQIANAINYYNYLNPDAKLTQSDVDGWSSQGDMESSVLGTLTPKLQPENFEMAIERVQVDGNCVATADNDIN